MRTSNDIKVCSNMIYDWGGQREETSKPHNKMKNIEKPPPKRFLILKIQYCRIFYAFIVILYNKD